MMSNTEEAMRDNGLQHDEKSLSRKIPRAYIEMLNRIFKETEEHRVAMKVTATTYVPQMYETLIKGGFSPEEAAEKVYTDGEEIGWAHRTILELLPAEAKSPEKVRAGQVAAEIAAKKRGLGSADEETRRRVAELGGAARALQTESLSEAGTKGGTRVRELYGQEYYSQIAKLRNREKVEGVDGSARGYTAGEDFELEYVIDVAKWAVPIGDAIAKAIESGSEKIAVKFKGKELEWVTPVVNVRPRAAVA